MLTETVVMYADGFRWMAGPGTDDAIGYGGHEASLEPVLRQLLPQGGVFLDIGAHVGRWTLRLSGQARRVIAIEANPDTATALRANLDLNRISNVVIHNVAAWDSHETLTLLDPNQHRRGGSTRTLPRVPGYPVTQAVPLDELLAGEPTIDLVKLDVEGADLHALRGMRQTLDRCRPPMFIEDHSIYAYYQFTDLTDLLGELGYDWGAVPQTYGGARYLVALPRKDKDDGSR